MNNAQQPINALTNGLLREEILHSAEELYEQTR